MKQLGMNSFREEVFLKTTFYMITKKEFVNNFYGNLLVMLCYCL